MRRQWVVATLSALALALLTQGAPLPLPFLHAAEASAPGACPANAKTANLNFTLKDINNKNVKLSDFKGKVVLLDFWATWCIPCKAEIPWFIEFQQRYGTAGLQVVGVSVDDTLDDLKPYVAQFKMNYPVLQGLMRDDIQDAYGPLLGIPVTTLISRSGKICAKHSGISTKQALENEIKVLLSEARSVT